MQFPTAALSASGSLGLFSAFIWHPFQIGGKDNIFLLTGQKKIHQNQGRIVLKIMSEI